MLTRRRHWIFDLNGTLTAAIHDFDGFRRDNGLPLGRPILEAIAGEPEPRRSALLERVHAWEREHVAREAAEPDAVALLEHLRSRGARLGILTRNSAGTAWDTLGRVGLRGYFSPDDVIGRDRAAAKPSPDGVLLLMRAWGASPEDTVMVGDYLFDVLAGRDAGAATVLVDRRGRGGEYGHLADVVVGRLDALLEG